MYICTLITVNNELKGYILKSIIVLVTFKGGKMEKAASGQREIKRGL